MGNDARLSVRIGLPRFLSTYPGMRVRPTGKDEVRLQGEFAFTAEYEDSLVIEDCYELNITVSRWYPHDLPAVKETGGRIPRDQDYHMFPSGGLCLGSPLRLHDIAVSTQELTAYAEEAIVPYLCAFSHWEETGEWFLFGELAHGAPGLLNDYANILNLDDPEEITEALRLLGMKRRKANKRPCPCGCGDRLGVCRYNETIRRLRDRHGRPFFRQLYRQLVEQTP